MASLGPIQSSARASRSARRRSHVPDGGTRTRSTQSPSVPMKPFARSSSSLTDFGPSRRASRRRSPRDATLRSVGSAWTRRAQSWRDRRMPSAYRQYSRRETMWIVVLMSVAWITVRSSRARVRSSRSNLRKARPQPDVARGRVLRLQAADLLHGPVDGQVRALEQELPGEEGPVELALRQGAWRRVVLCRGLRSRPPPLRGAAMWPWCRTRSHRSVAELRHDDRRVVPGDPPARGKGRGLGRHAGPGRRGPRAGRRHPRCPDRGRPSSGRGNAARRCRARDRPRPGVPATTSRPCTTSGLRSGIPELVGQDRVVPYMFPTDGMLDGLPWHRPAAVHARAGRYAFDTMTPVGPGHVGRRARRGRLCADRGRRRGRSAPRPRMRCAGRPGTTRRGRRTAGRAT